MTRRAAASRSREAASPPLERRLKSFAGRPRSDEWTGVDTIAFPRLRRPSRWGPLERVLALGALYPLSAGSGRGPALRTPVTVAEWPINMIGSWALVERTPRARVADTTVWILGAAGVLEHPEVQVGARGGALATRERAIATSQHRNIATVDTGAGGRRAQSARGVRVPTAWAKLGMRAGDE